MIGALIGYKFNLKQRIAAEIMAFGSGVLISALSFKLMDTFRKVGFLEVATGFLSGALIYTLANVLLNKFGGKHKKIKYSSKGIRKQQRFRNSFRILNDEIPKSIIIRVGLI